MSDKIKAKNVEIYLAKIDSIDDFTPATRGNNKTLLAYTDDAVGSLDVSNWTKVTNSDKVNEFQLEPNDDESTTSTYYGSDSSGNQNSDTETTDNNEVSITLTTDVVFEQVLDSMALEAESVTHSSYSDYTSYNLASRTTDTLLMFVRVKRLISGTYYFKNFLLINPIFNNTGKFGGASDDASLSTEYSLVGNKTKIFKDNYSSTTDESVTNIAL